FGTPFPTIIYGHGLNSPRTQGKKLAEFAAPLGIATIAIDAPEHGDHPTAEGNEGLDVIFGFFGIDLGETLADFAVDSEVLRDSWQQAAYDKLSLLEVMGDTLDVDGDGQPDITTQGLTYLGVSLGSIMGPQFLALTDRIDAAVLVIGGGRVTDIIQLGDLFGAVIGLLVPPGLDEGDVARYFPLLQTAIERGDAGNWAPYLVQQRLQQGAPPIQILDAAVLDDE